VRRCEAGRALTSISKGESFVRTAFIDLETTGTCPGRHDVWEIGLIIRDEHDLTGGHAARRRDDAEYLWEIYPDLSLADPGALRVSGYYRRRCLDVPGNRTGNDHDAVALVESGSDLQITMKAERVAAAVASLTNDAQIVAANPAFDAGFLESFLRRHGHCPAWDYHLRDIGSLVTGYIAGWDAAWHACPDVPGLSLSGMPSSPLSPKLADMARALEIDPLDYEAHAALGDARLARDIWDRVTGGATQ
jgi:DNA polymerase III epsilon subunit-like protein